jgi:hypothetical protein
MSRGERDIFWGRMGDSLLVSSILFEIYVVDKVDRVDTTFHPFFKKSEKIGLF